MTQRHLLFVANWKMYITYEQSLTFALTHKHDLCALAENEYTHIIVCPSFPALSPIINIFHDTPIAVGAQNCSSFSHGAYTGEVSAEMLTAVGCRYCIIGHGERRTLFKETAQEVAQKVIRALEHDLHPILCIGETRDEYEKGHTTKALATQLAPVIDEINKSSLAHKPLCIAYEPYWAIGAGSIPTISYIQDISSWIIEYCKKTLPTTPISLLYGGSVDENSASQLLPITTLDGLLIGRASTDLEKFKNIVSLHYR